MPLRCTELPAHDAGAKAALTTMPEASLAARDMRALQARLQTDLQALLPGLQLEVADSLGSTNTQLLDTARCTPAGQACTPRLLVALEQTQGRGRVGRTWHAAPGDSLTFSVALALAPASWSGLSLAVGLALAEALDPCAQPEPGGHIGLKWPNDLWLWDGPGQGRKLGGILIETVMAGSQRVCVVGVGLNVAPQTDPSASTGASASASASAGASASASASASWGCLQQLQPAWTAPGALDCVAAPLLQALLQFEHDGFAALARAYARRDLLLGQPVDTLLAGMPALRGTAAGVDADGALLLRSGDVVHRVASGEVSVRLTQRAPAGCVPC